MKIVIVGGKFDQGVGKASHLVSLIEKSLSVISEKLGETVEVELINGGNMNELRGIVHDGEIFEDSQALLWMPDVDNSHAKILPNIKRAYPHLVLIQSKRVIEKEYDDFSLIKRMLASHSALMMKVEKENGSYMFSVIDPLGNSWCTRKNVVDASNSLWERVFEICKMSRMRSVQRGEREEFSISPEFISQVKRMGEIFDSKVKAINPERFLGNASTRCAHGFPSARTEEGTIFVSQRNVDKTIISEDSFVEVELKDGMISYKGDRKPSVDTPIQVKLYEAYPNVNYMIHGHCYVKGAPFTKNNVPCGFLEEVDEILSLFPDMSSTNFCVNLRGHGCLIMAKEPEFFNKQEFESRPFLEKQNENEGLSRKDTESGKRSARAS